LTLHRVPEEPNVTAAIRVVLFLVVLIRYVQYWRRFELMRGNGGKFVVRMLLVPFILFLFVALVAALGKATDLGENLQVLLIVPGVAGVVCLWLIDHHHREDEK
jgi:hypothetical protein